MCKQEQQRKSFVFYFEWAEVLSGFPTEVRYEVYDAIIRYAQSGTLTELKPLANMAFSFIKNDIDRDFDKFLKTSEGRSKAGKIGASRKWQTDGKNGNCHEDDDVDVDDDVDDDDDEDEKKEKKEKKKFVIPSVDEIRAYCNERNSLIDPQSFFDFYESKGWMVGKNKMKDWKAAIRTWERKDKEANPQKYVEPPKQKDKWQR